MPLHPLLLSFTTGGLPGGVSRGGVGGAQEPGRAGLQVLGAGVDPRLGWGNLGNRCHFLCRGFLDCRTGVMIACLQARVWPKAPLPPNRSFWGIVSASFPLAAFWLLVKPSWFLSTVSLGALSIGCPRSRWEMTALGTKDPTLGTQTAAALVPEAWLSLCRGLI